MLFHCNQGMISGYILKITFADELVKGLRKAGKSKVILRILPCAIE